MVDQHLVQLPYAEGAAFDSHLREHDPECFPDTRVKILRQIILWTGDPRAALVFWMNGMAGTGKSTISRSVARACADQGRLGASFFFSRGQGDLGHAARFFTSLAVQLANVHPTLKRYICEAIADHPDIAQRALRDQWKELIMRPLAKLKSNSLPSSILTLVVDALDECNREDDIRLILRLVTEAKDLDTIRLRVFITSRLETPIRLGFRDISGIIYQAGRVYQDVILHNISRSVVDHDISIFLQRKFERIRTERDLPADWPEKRDLQLLVQKAEGLFIYASTACRSLGVRNGFQMNVFLSSSEVEWLVLTRCTFKC